MALPCVIESDVLKFEDEPAYVGSAPNFMARLSQLTDKDADAFEVVADDCFVQGDEE